MYINVYHTYFLSRYMRMYLGILTRVMMKEPRATEPIWCSTRRLMFLQMVQCISPFSLKKTQTKYYSSSISSNIEQCSSISWKRVFPDKFSKFYEVVNISATPFWLSSVNGIEQIYHSHQARDRKRWTSTPKKVIIQWIWLFPDLKQFSNSPAFPWLGNLILVFQDGWEPWIKWNI